MEILNEKKFFIKEISEDKYIFYNSVEHIACLLDSLSLNICNLIYKYKTVNCILPNISEKYHQYVSNSYQKIAESRLLNTVILDQNIKKDQDIKSPVKFYLHMTYECNLGCIYCYNKDIRTHKNKLKAQDWFKIIDIISPFANYIVFTGGEPFLNKNLLEIVNYVRAKIPDITIEIISNCMNDFEHDINFQSILSQVDKITLSCDDLLTEKQIRKNFKPSLFIGNMKFIRRNYRDLHVTISSTFIKGKEKELQFVEDFAAFYDVVHQRVLVSPNNEDEKKLLPELVDYKEVVGKDRTKLENLPDKRKFCGAGLGVLSIDPLGNVYPCHNLHYEEFCYGNLLKQDYMTILNSELSVFFHTKPNIEFIEKCNICNLKYICYGGCRAASYKLEGDLNKTPETLCDYYKEEAINKLLRACMQD